MTLPWSTHTPCTSAAQSSPTKNYASSIKNLPRGSDDTARGPSSGQPLPDAQGHISLSQVHSHGRADGSTVIQALKRQPAEAITSARPESQQRPLLRPPEAWCPRDRRRRSAQTYPRRLVDCPEKPMPRS